MEVMIEIISSCTQILPFGSIAPEKLQLMHCFDKYFFKQLIK